MHTVNQNYQLLIGEVTVIEQLHYEVDINYGPIETIIINILTKEGNLHYIKLAGLEVISKFECLDIRRSISITFLKKRQGYILAVDIYHTTTEEDF